MTTSSDHINQSTPHGRPGPLALASEGELEDLYLSGLDASDGALRSPEKAHDAVVTAYEKLSTSHPWDPARLPLRPYFLLLAKNVVHDMRKTTDGPDAELRARYKTHDLEARHEGSLSPEEVAIEREEQQRRMREACDLVDRLRQRVAHHPVASALLEAWSSDVPPTPAQLAARLGVDVKQVYAAKQLLEYHTRKIQQKRGRR